MLQTLTIAIDFDGTIVEHRYPEIGKILPFAFETLKQLQEEGHNLILWTYRAGDMLDKAVGFCEENGMEFYAVNQNYPEEGNHFDGSRKILADIYIDDRNIGGFAGWSQAYRMIKEGDREFLSKSFEKHTKNKTVKQADFLSGFFKRRK
jgi:hydroxymethylpyrimidine pyrophosphatase-like HAD family hydrolase